MSKEESNIAAPKGLKPGANIRAEFPIFAARAGERPLAYLDTAASSQKPEPVLQALDDFMRSGYANIHRGTYDLSTTATAEYEAAREKIAKFIGAASSQNIVFTRGTTEAINLVASSFAKYFKPGDSILITTLEHHSNIVPWQILSERLGVELHFVQITAEAQINMDDFYEKLSRVRPRLVASSFVSNAFGTVSPVKEIIAAAHEAGAKVLLDAAQAVPHQKVDVTELDVDFLAFSGHKMYGPTGIGALYAKTDLLDFMDPYQGGGDMIETVSIHGTTYADGPQKFEAGTPAIAEAIALGATIDFIESVGIEKIATYEAELFTKAFEMLSKEEGVTCYGPATIGAPQAAAIAFNVEGAHSHDIATFADQFNVQIRAGHHCAMPALEALGLSATARMSLGMYSTEADIEQLLEAIRFTRKAVK